GASAVSGEFRVVVWHRKPPKVRGGFVSCAARRKRSLADSNGRSAGYESLSRRSAGRGALAGFADRVHFLFSQRSGIVRKGRARNYPSAPVSKGGIGQVLASGDFVR